MQNENRKSTLLQVIASDNMISDELWSDIRDSV